MSAKKQSLKQVQADAERITRRRLFEPDDDGNVFEPNYPNGYLTDAAEVEESEEASEQTPIEKARAAKAAKAAKAGSSESNEKESK